MPGITSTTTTQMTTPLLTATTCSGHTHLIVGATPVAAARAQRSIDAGAHVVLIAPECEPTYSLQRRIDDGSVTWLRREFSPEDLETQGRAEVDGVVDLVWITIPPSNEAREIADRCKRLRIPVNTLDSPQNSTFTLLSTHSQGPLHIGITTSGNGCKLASRIRRELAAALPPDMGDACTRIGTLRRGLLGEAANEGEDEAAEQTAGFNALVPAPAAVQDSPERRLRWLSQICEYWPLPRLCALTASDLSSPPPTTVPPPPPEQKKGRILLVGSGPGHPGLLTTAAKEALEAADVVLADKLVPSAVLSLIPRRTRVFIARKFPGNAEAAQEELLSRGLAAAREGATVVRLKQGDPYIFGRGGEEVLFFEREGFGPVAVIPGITSAFSAAACAGIPTTQRGVADQVLVCTGTGRHGAAPAPPEWCESRTTVFLMALHRVGALVAELEGNGWPLETPCAVVERASCADQRVVRTRLRDVGRAVEAVGSRPPGLLVVGAACKALREVPEEGWIVEEGFAGF